MPSNTALYILLRNDMASMTPGRAAAQSSHITSAFGLDCAQWENKTQSSVDVWENETEDGFGTAIVLGGSLENIKKTLDKARGLHYNHGNRIVHDPTYVVPDGDTIHLVDIPVGGYFFTENRDRLKEDGVTELLELF
tara:strand:+ start:424 stop:834 length:411 start_codon:yes stop_codon:yes gene_type:complete